jgi:hypothetical protein
MRCLIHDFLFLFVLHVSVLITCAISFNYKNFRFFLLILKCRYHMNIFYNVDKKLTRHVVKCIFI